MHPLDLSPQANSSHSTLLFSSAKSIRSSRKAVDQNNKDASCKTTSKLGNKREQDQGKRGRPRADILTALMVQGSSSRSKIRCIKCGRAFPREKSLQAHVRTHTGEKPYACDYPGCSKAFCQSGQLKTHQRLHTGEKPFTCVVEGCESRFTHANRHCSTHPYAGLKRLEIGFNQVTRLTDSQSNPDVKRWIEKYTRQSKERLTSKPLPKKPPVHESIPSKQTRPGTSVKIRGTGAYKTRKAVSPPIQFCPVQEEKIIPLDLTQNKRPPSLPRLSPIPYATKAVLGLPPPLIPIMPQLPSPVPLVLTVQTSSPVTSSTKSQSSQLSSPSYLPLSLHSASPPSSTLLSPTSLLSSSSSASSTTSLHTLYRHHSASLPLPEGNDEFYPYVFSSQMVLQGHSNVNGSYYSHCFPIPVSYRPTSSSVPEQSNPHGKEKEKDRYISALALIELSKG